MLGDDVMKGECRLFGWVFVVSLVVLLLCWSCCGLFLDGIVLFEFKVSLNDLYGYLRDWNFEDEFLCEWIGVFCFSSL